MKYNIELVEGRKNPKNDLASYLGFDFNRYLPWFLGGAVLFLMFGGFAAGREIMAWTTRREFAQVIDGILAELGFGRVTRLMIIAQAGVETAMGTKGTAVQGRNYWNMSAGPSWTGPVVLGQDKEPDGSGGWRTITQKWRAYASDEEAVLGFLTFLQMTRYKQAYQLLINGEPSAFVRELHRAGYYTWPVDDFVDENGKKQTGYLSMFNGQYNLAESYVG